MTQQSQLVIPPKLFYLLSWNQDRNSREVNPSWINKQGKAKLNKTADSAKAPGSTLTLKARSGKVFCVTAPLKKFRSKITKSTGVFENISQEYLGKSYSSSAPISVSMLTKLSSPANPPLCAAAGGQLGSTEFCAAQACCWMCRKAGEKGKLVSRWYLNQ